MTGVNGDAPATRPLWFDAATGGEALPARWTVEDIARSLSPSAEWTLESLPSGAAPLVLRPRLDDDRLILGARLEDRSLEITLTPDVSGWVRVTAAFNGSSVFCAFLDRPYEEFELWPPGSDITPRRITEAPGRIGKRLNWIILSVSAWPSLASLANPSGCVMAAARDV